MQGRQDVETPPVISVGDSAPLLQFVESTFDQVTSLIQFPVVIPGFLSVSLGRETASAPWSLTKASSLLLSYPLSAMTLPALIPVSKGMAGATSAC